MREIDARVTGFDYTTFHAYTTEVQVDGRTWTLAIRYNIFYQFYTRLTALEKHFTVAFPPKGGLFFSPPPEERQEQLDDFLLSTLAYFDMRGHPRRMEALLGELLQIPQHLGVKDDDEERTASEGSSEAEELLNTPMPGHDSELFEEDKTSVSQRENEATLNNARKALDEPNAEMKKPIVEAKTEIVTGSVVQDNNDGINDTMNATLKPERSAENHSQKESEELSGSSVSRNYIATLRRQTLVNGAIQAAVVSIMKENVEKTKGEKPVEDDKTIDKEQEMEDLEEKKNITDSVDESTLTTEAHESSISMDTVKDLAVVEPMNQSVPEHEQMNQSVPEQEQDVKMEELQTSEDEVSTSEENLQSSPQKNFNDNRSMTEGAHDNPVFTWLRRMGTLVPSSTEKEEQEAMTAAKEQEEKEAAAKKEQEEKLAKAKAEAEAKAQAEAKAAAEAKEAELLRIEQELNLRLRRYRHPVFFHGFNCDVGTSRYSLPELPSDGIIV